MNHDDHLLNPGQGCVRVTVSPAEYAQIKEYAAAEGVDIMDYIRWAVDIFALPGQSSDPCIHLSIDPEYTPPEDLTFTHRKV